MPTLNLFVHSVSLWSLIYLHEILVGFPDSVQAAPSLRSCGPRPFGTCKEIMHSTGRMSDMMGVVLCLVGFLWLKADACDCVGVLVRIDVILISCVCVHRVLESHIRSISNIGAREELCIINSMALASKKVVDLVHGALMDTYAHSWPFMHFYFLKQASKLACVCVCINVIGNLCVRLWVTVRSDCQCDTDSCWWGIHWGQLRIDSSQLWCSG